MVIAGEPKLMEVRHGIRMLIDGRTGNMYVEPTDEIVRRFEQQNKSSVAVKEKALQTKPRTVSADGTEVFLMANINLLGDLDIAQEVKCAGIGLYRTEFPFIIRNNFPSEQEQYFTYKKLIDGMDHKPVTFRTLDIGGDKMLSYYHQAHEQNPAMGMRSIRFSLRNRDIFAQQIRAILRAGAGSEIRIMFPMISSLEDFLAAKGVVLSCIEELASRQTEHNNSPAIGMMVELPSVLNLIDAFAAEADFFSIGTNDLIQFMLGADRTNENVDDFYIPHHPSVLRTIAAIVRAAQKEAVDVSVCGDMARHGAYVQWLIGVGVRTLSLDPAYIPRIQQTIERINVGDAQRLAEKVLAETRIDAIEELLGISNEPAD
jgi:phosphotransferase system enzyme I (PtsP)